MIFKYGTSIRGKAHIDRNVVCQDAHKIKEFSNGWVIAAVADGLGSAAHSDIGAKIAVEVLVKFCEDNIPFDGNSIIKKEALEALLQVGYFKAYKEILHYATENNLPFESLDTTLSAVIYSGRKIVYGHVGDGGIVGLSSTGVYIPITERQKGETSSSVIPLRYGSEHWVISSSEEELSAVMLFTDGIYDQVVPPILNKTGQPIYVPRIRKFCDDHLLKINNTNHKAITAKLEKELTDPFWDAVTDDKTIVTLVNSEIVSDVLNASYYDEPDWKKLKKEAYRNIYSGWEEPTNTGPKKLPQKDAQKAMLFDPHEEKIDAKQGMQQSKVIDKNGTKEKSESRRKNYFKSGKKIQPIKIIGLLLVAVLLMSAGYYASIITNATKSVDRMLENQEVKSATEVTSQNATVNKINEADETDKNALNILSQSNSDVSYDLLDQSRLTSLQK